MSTAVLDAIAAHARRERPHECCGLLVGSGDAITEAVAARNAAADTLRHYEVAPEDYFAAVRRCRERARGSLTRLDVIGVYHSHPRSAPAPSPTDVALACEELVYLIIGATGNGDGPMEIRAFRFRCAAFEPLPLEPET